MGIVRLQRMTFYGYHGVSKAERETGRRFEVDCELEFDFAEAGQTDSLKNTIDYTRIYATIDDILTSHDVKLLETLATRIVERIIKDFPVQRVSTRVRKMIPPIPGNLDYIEVELEKKRES